MQPVSVALRAAQRPLRRQLSRSPTTPALRRTRLRFTGTAIETVEAAVLTRDVERNEVLKSSDVVIERRPKAEVGNDAASREPRGRHADAQGPARRPGAAGRRSRQAGSGAARPECHADLRSQPGSISPSAARRWTAAPKATSSACSICNPSAPCPAPWSAAARSRSRSPRRAFCRADTTSSIGAAETGAAVSRRQPATP